LLTFFCDPLKENPPSEQKHKPPIIFKQYSLLKNPMRIIVLAIEQGNVWRRRRPAVILLIDWSRGQLVALDLVCAHKTGVAKISLVGKNPRHGDRHPRPVCATHEADCILVQPPIFSGIFMTFFGEVFRKPPILSMKRAKIYFPFGDDCLAKCPGIKKAGVGRFQVRGEQAASLALTPCSTFMGGRTGISSETRGFQMRVLAAYRGGGRLPPTTLMMRQRPDANYTSRHSVAPSRHQTGIDEWLEI